MGSLFSRQKSSINELEQIVLKLDKLNLRSSRLQENRYNLLWWLTVLFLFAASTYSGVICVNDTQPRIPLVLLTWSVGISLFLLFRFIMVRLFDFIIRRDQRSVQALNTRRKKIIEEVKENEKFKVAKEIIEKYGSPEDLAEIGVANDKNKKANSSPSMLKQPNNLNSSNDSASENELQKQPTSPPTNQTLNPEQDVTLMKQKRIAPFNQAFATPAFRRQPIRPFIQPTRTPIDKIIDLIVGDGPGNRFALICKQCKVHNGMAVAEEFYDMSFICFNCGLYNPARNAEPHFNPKLNAPNRLFLTGSPVSSPTIRTATNSESSDNEEEDENDTLKNSGKSPVVEAKNEEKEEETASDN